MSTLKQIIAIRSDLYEHEIKEHIAVLMGHDDEWTEQEWLNHCLLCAERGRKMPWEIGSFSEEVRNAN